MEADRRRERIALLGASGQVGRELLSALAPLGEVIALTRDQADLAAPESLRGPIRAVRPTVVVNAAAYTAVDDAESHPDLAYRVNAASPGVLAEEAQSLGAVMVHYSTDYVFDGARDGWYTESDTAHPLSVYGRSKLEGEHAVAAATARHLILRTSWVHGTHGRNFLKTILRLAAERDTLRVVADQHGAPTAATVIARMTAEALRQLTVAGQERWGTYHLVASGTTTWHEYACRVVVEAAARGLALRASASDIVPITSDEYPVAARRPLNSRLSTARFREAFSVSLPSWQAGVDGVLDQLISRP